MAPSVRRIGSGLLGKSRGPDRGAAPEPLVSEGAAADAAIAESRRRTTSRRELERNPRFEQVSPEVGELDEAAAQEGLLDDPDEMMALLADLTGATDQRLRELARRFAGRLFLDLARRGPVTHRGVGRLTEQPFRPDGGDIEIDASLETITAAAAAGAAIDVDRLRIRSWSTPQTALCLLVDRSGSMGGKPLATAAVAAAAVAWRAPADYSVLAFAKDVIVVKSQGVDKASEQVVNDVLSLRGHGTTDLAGALHCAARQLAHSRAARKITIVLSDCRSTVDGDVRAAVGALEELVVIAPEDDSAEAFSFAATCGARVVTVTGPAAVAEALAAALER